MTVVLGYLIIGAIVSIVETTMAYLDAKKLGLTIYDLNPELVGSKKAIIILAMISVSIVLAIVWPGQVYYWIRRIV